MIQVVIERVVACANHPELPAIWGLWVFGSYARGEMEPGDVDLVVEYDTADPDRDMIEAAFGRGPLPRLEPALREGLPSVVIMWSRYGPTLLGDPPRLLWRRGEGVEVGRTRLEALAGQSRSAPGGGTEPSS